MSRRVADRSLGKRGARVRDTRGCILPQEALPLDFANLRMREEEFFFERGKVLLVEAEVYFQGTVGQAATPAEDLDHLVHEFIDFHNASASSSSSALASCRSFVSNSSVNQP